MKRTFLTTICALAILSLTAAACSSGGGNKVEPAEWPLAAAQSMCSWQFKCCTDAELAEQGQTDEATCVTDTTEMLNMFMGGINTALASGHGVWDADAAGQCVDNVASVGCNSGFGSNPANVFEEICGEFIIPQQAAGDDCDSIVDCQSGLYCEEASSTCKALPGAGEACGDDYACAAGLYCDDALECQTVKAVGDDCSDFGGWMECASTYCDPDTFKCAPAPESCVGR